MDIQISDIVVDDYMPGQDEHGPIAAVRIDCPDGQSPQIEVSLWDNKRLAEADSEFAGDWEEGEPRFVGTLDGEGQEFTAEQCRQWAAVLLKAAETLERIESEEAV